MARVTINTISAQKKTTDIINGIIKSDDFLKDVGTVIVNNFQGAARLGKDTNKEKFASLEDKTIDARKRMVKYSSQNRGSFYSPTKPLNLSGQLIDSIKFSIVKKSDGSWIEIGPSGKRRPYINKDGTASKNTIDNEELGRIHSKGDGQKKRNFMTVGDKLRNTVVNYARRAIRRLLKNV